MLFTLYFFSVCLIVGALGYLGSSSTKGLYGHYKRLVISGGDKGSSYECGFVDMNESMNTYTMQFYIIGLSFMLFDLEILIIIPMVVTGAEGYEALSAWGLGKSFFLVVVSMAAYYEVMGGVVSF
uniref:NADH-ubiquinone oxidoreductase chain 3 n=1 Tax=Phallusia mammillata TaxID=59560 RepID=A7WL65_9ASCI|nr:NADH dehydrogenase subunit 3 [Phallusia mammillata]CAL23078.2 NADH dehydrogenase subunit 3 [Phallusia mammillata]